MTAETNHSSAPAAGKRARISNETLLQGETDPLTDRAVHLLQLDGVGKHYGNIIALRDVTMAVDNGRVTCVLGDNGAGKSTLIKIIAGLHQHDQGVFSIMGEERKLNSPREALDAGIAAVYQDLAVVALMPIWRNFFLGSELTTGRGPFRRMDVEKMKEVTRKELADMGIDLRDVEQPIGQLSGGERQCVAIARAVHFGAKVLILDEPTAALGVKQSGVVLRYILQARDRGLGVIFITHNPHHAFPVGDRFLLLKRGRSIGYYDKKDITLEELTAQMAGGAELAELAHELESLGGHRDTLEEVKAETASVTGKAAG
ncbi:ABC transporter related [Pseudarthrobacter chlorophenolicus A6]|uniref:ABC transporter related n=1 Tax=Pseudarthrobacter chlorophenolicus (strain ATCC 700700 / DSM 12829 / CIP 107037 / JCM 12360 / KCTC 9906 / NCIMB 13794 / A6) TaxID=452863 RepID=B8H8E4_PSECP|nr:ATP-binding cassette domain-containing protein [Pseudarthrobacter chlorophenolicus]ACL38118.1 ABC transporter related [Pseudarthrobacter chlorophenolicus A6]SDQ54967.1 monosaccharide ABC transporter ATP-binding protein, CUT2 family [Pseudarthrobacter chlorophenolicus]